MVHTSTDHKILKEKWSKSINMTNQLFPDGGPYNIETSPLICIEKEWVGFYSIGTSVVKESNVKL